MESNAEKRVVEKETIATLNFPQHDVLTNVQDQEARISALHKATSLGNLSKHKVHITFEDAEGLKEVNTTIWAITDKKIILKAGSHIPVNRILAVRMN